MKKIFWVVFCAILAGCTPVQQKVSPADLNYLNTQVDGEAGCYLFFPDPQSKWDSGNDLIAFDRALQEFKVKNPTLTVRSYKILRTAPVGFNPDKKGNKTFEIATDILVFTTSIVQPEQPKQLEQQEKK